MTTIVLSAVGAAIGGATEVSVLGASGAALGQLGGALIGGAIDQRLLGKGTEVVETGRVSRLRLTGSGEGDAIAQIYGRVRVPGQVIWATHFLENIEVTGGGGGKGSPSPATPETHEHSYSVSFALALCEGVITHVSRIWANGTEIARDSLNMAVYYGTDDQMPDPKMEATEGAGRVPAYRGTAYVVIENLALGSYGNSMPQFTFEVCRPAQPGDHDGALDPAHSVRGVALLPGSGEYALATTPVRMDFGPGSGRIVNVNTPSAKPDFPTSLDSLIGEVPGCRTTSLIVSWFGDDLRCNTCKIRPKVEQNDFDASNMPWIVSGVVRDAAGIVPQDTDNRPIYGGTPTDAAVIEAVQSLQSAGQDVMFYPFILMEQTQNNGLPDPYSDAEDQPILPWRGRITLSKAPGRSGSPDQTAAAEAEVAAFFGQVSVSDFLITPVSELEEETPSASPGIDFMSGDGTQKISPIRYVGDPLDWGYRRFILHNAALCAAVGGVESFCIGSEMRALTWIRGEANSFPAVEALVALLEDVRAILGPDVKITYAADWSEYFGYQPGNGDRFFHLDQLWAHEDIDFIGIDNYMPLSDWREGREHLDQDWHSIYNLDYLQANIEGGEGYDWYYHSPEARAAQIRTPITDDEHQEPWIWRYKDIRNWWQHFHHERVNGERAALPTGWVPQSKPIRFTEYGCASIDKGTNQPNKFLDSKSSESKLPKYSNGLRDDLIQFQYLRAMNGYWTDSQNNPISEEYEAPMLDMEHACVWAWDARPFPFFPSMADLWSDGYNYARGHWLNGRVSSRTLASVVNEICERSDMVHHDTRHLYGLVRGYLRDVASDGRADMQPLMLRYGFDAIERNGKLRFRLRDGHADHHIDSDHVARMESGDGPVTGTRDSDIELAGRVQLRFIEAEGDFEVIAEEAILPTDETHAVARSEVPLVMTRAEGRQTVERWLSESRVATDSIALTLPPSRLDVQAGDVVALDEEGGLGRYRIDRVEQYDSVQRIDAVRVEPESYRPVEIIDSRAGLKTFKAPTPLTPLFLDLPLMTGEEIPHAPHLGVMVDRWSGPAALYSSDVDSNYTLNTLINNRSVVGTTLDPLKPAQYGVIDRGKGISVKMISGALESIGNDAFLAGGNLCALGDGTPDGWELLQFRDAELIGANTYRITHRLQGQLGTERLMDEGWPAGSILVRLNGLPQQIDLAEIKRGVPRHYRFGPASLSFDDPTYQHAELIFKGVGLRPLSPVHMSAQTQSSGDLDVRWIRRTRIDGDRWETPDVPLGEEREIYLVRVRVGDDILREEIVEAAQWIYSENRRAGDGVSGFYQIEVAQISAKYGEGRFASINVFA